MRYCALALLAVIIGLSGTAGAPVPKKKADEVKMTDAGRKATARALAWLVRQQNSDGSWSEPRYPHNPGHFPLTP